MGATGASVRRRRRKRPADRKERSIGTVLAWAIPAATLVLGIVIWLFPKPIPDSSPTPNLSVSALNAEQVELIDIVETIGPGDSEPPADAAVVARRDEVALEITFFNGGEAPALVNEIEARILFDTKLLACRGAGGELGIAGRRHLNLSESGAEVPRIARVPLDFEVAAGAHEAFLLSVGHDDLAPYVTVIELTAVYADGSSNDRIPIGTAAVVSPLYLLGAERARPFWTDEGKTSSGQTLRAEDCSPDATTDAMAAVFEAADEIIESEGEQTRVTRSPDFVEMRDRYRARVSHGGGSAGAAAAARDDRLASRIDPDCGTGDAELRADHRFGGDDGREYSLVIGSCPFASGSSDWARVMKVGGSNALHVLLPNADVPWPMYGVSGQVTPDGFTLGGRLADAPDAARATIRYPVTGAELGAPETECWSTSGPVDCPARGEPGAP